MTATPDATPPALSRSRVLLSKWGNILGRFLALIIVFTFFAVLVEDGKFYTVRNLENILRQSCVYATAGLGLTLVIIAAGIDLSAGSLIALSVVVVAWVLNLNIGAPGSEQSIVLAHPTLAPILAVGAGILASTLAGLANGAMVVGLRLVPFIVTLGTMGMIRGLAKGIAHERDIYPPEETWISSIMDPTLSRADQTWQILPTGVWILIGGVIVSSLLLRYMRLGRHIFAVGSNEETARLCGVPVHRTKLLVYTASGFFCGVAGLMQFSYIGGIGQPTTAVMYELFVIAAVIIGGASFKGGEGSIIGTLIGALTITILYMGGQQMGWPKWVQEMVIGGIIIIAVAVDRFRHRRIE
ncbi:MAG TPA: ABC transporter permease [Verrucomicrobiae bacterium]|nr:ABC transporter permease [Verrucomicrobiae bacterium]